MALFTDGTIAKLADLRAYESGVLDLASAEGVDVAAKLRVAQKELSTELVPFLTRRGASRDLRHVVVNDAMTQSHALRTLALIYRDLYQSRLNDRYEGKWREYALQADRAMQRMFDAGVGVTRSPLGQTLPAAASVIAGGLLPVRTYCLQVALAGAGGTTGARSEPMSLSLGLGQKAVVAAPAMSPGASGWFVYAGESEDKATVQTANPLAPDEVWSEPNSGLATGLQAWPVQGPDYFVENRRDWLRG